MALRNLFQLLAARETDAGTVNGSLISSSNAGLVINPTLTFAPESFTREVVRGSLSPSAPLAGAIPGTCTFGVELAAASSTPFWHLLLEACGYRKWAINSYDTATLTNTAHTVAHILTGDVFGDSATANYSVCVADKFGNASSTDRVYVYEAGTGDLADVGGGSISGTVISAPGSAVAAGFAFTSTSQEVVTFGVTTTSAQSIAIGDLLIGATGGTVLEALQAVAVSQTNQTTRFRILAGGSISDSEVLNDAAGTPQATVHTSANKVLADVPTISIALIEDGRAKVLRGCRGNVTFSAGNIGEPVIMNFTFSGAFSSIVDRTAFPNVSFNALTPPVARGAVVTLGTDRALWDSPAEYVTPCIASFTVDTGNTVTTRRCMDDTSGVLNAAITRRQGTLTFDPEITPEAFFPFLDMMVNNDGFRFNLDWGTIANDGARFALKVPDCQTITETVGDREGVATDEYTSNIGARLPEDAGEGSDRDITLLHITADS